MPNTIFALATRAHPSHAALIRISGALALKKSQTLFSGASLITRASFNATIDLPVGTVPATGWVLPAPHTLTGDDTIELRVPGNPEIVRQLEERLRELGFRDAERGEFTRRALDAGATGYLLKEAPASQLAGAIRTVAAGGRAIDPELALEAWGEADPLTDRERQVLRAAAQGVNTAAIAERLGLSDGTVRNYLSEAIGKLGAANRIDAARIARERGWL